MSQERLIARTIMTGDVRTARIDSSLADCLVILDREGFSQIPVLRGRKPVALLTETDVRRALLQNREHRPVGELASPLPRLLSPEDRLADVLQALKEQDSVLIVSSTGRLQGIITFWDVLNLGRPFLMVTEVELILRRLVAATYKYDFGPDWWYLVPEELRREAEAEHRADEGEEPTPEHMLSHTSFWALIQIYRSVRPELGDVRFEELHRIRRLRNRIAHHAHLSSTDDLELMELCFRAGDWLIPLMPDSQCPHVAGGDRIPLA